MINMVDVMECSTMDEFLFERKKVTARKVSKDGK
jgi:hypothetical protein